MYASGSLRILDKWAVLIGGGENHRMGLYDMLMIKDNHVAASGGITPAVKRARDYLGGRGLALDIEVCVACLWLPAVIFTMYDSIMIAC